MKSRIKGVFSSFSAVSSMTIKRGKKKSIIPVSLHPVPSHYKLSHKIVFFITLFIQWFNWKAVAESHLFQDKNL